MLDRTGTAVKEERASKQAPLADAEVKALIASVATVRIARGRKILERPSAETKPADLKGPTGNYRAPMIRRGKVLLVGFNPEALGELLK